MIIQEAVLTEIIGEESEVLKIMESEITKTQESELMKMEESEIPVEQEIIILEGGFKSIAEE